MSGEGHWAQVLYDYLNDTGTDDQRVIQFIRDSVPNDEGRLADNKRKMFIGADSNRIEKEREYDLVRHICALANVQDNQDYRYLFIGFGNDRGLIGIDNWQSEGGKDIYEIDDVEIQNIIDDSLEPSPVVERYRLDYDGKKAVILAITNRDPPPVLVTKSTRDDRNVYLEEGVAYTRKGSKTRKMQYTDFRVMIERREELIRDTFESITEDLNRVVGIPSEQLQEMDLTVSPGDDGAPVEEVLSTDAAEGIDQRLTVSTKSWNSSGELIGTRRNLYEYHRRKPDLDLTETKLECLIRSNWGNYLGGYVWVDEYLQVSQGISDLMREAIQNDLNGNNYGLYEKVCLMLGLEECLELVDNNFSYDLQKSDTYLSKVDMTPEERLDEIITRSSVEIDGEEYKLNDILNHKKDGYTALEILIDDLIENDPKNKRGKYRSVELSMYGHLSGIVP